LSVILGLAAVGYVQASGTLIGPMTILFQAMSLVTIPEAARVLRNSPGKFRLFCVLLSGGLAAVGAAWGAVLLVGLPRGLGNLMLGPIWVPTYPLVLPTMIAVVATAASTGAYTGLHALGAAKKSLRAMILGSVMFIGLSLAGAIIWRSAAGAIWGNALGGWLAVMLSWRQFRTALREARLIPGTGAHPGAVPDTTHQPGPAGSPRPATLTGRRRQRYQGRHAQPRQGMGVRATAGAALLASITVIAVGVLVGLLMLHYG
jgi:O-antigen/teichoic acid export membrane protein